MTHAEMRVAVERADHGVDHPMDQAEEANPASDQLAPAPALPAPRSALPTPPEPHPLAVPRFGLGYAASWSGDEMGARHGPLVRLGLDHIGGAPLSISATLESDLAQRYEAADVGVRTQSTSVRLLVGGEWPLGDALGFSFGIGGGLDANRVRPFVPAESVVSPHAQMTNVTWVSRAEASLDMRAGPFVFGLGPRVDASLNDTHYDLARGGTLQRVVTPWPVVPGIQVLAAWCPRNSKSGGNP